MNHEYQVTGYCTIRENSININGKLELDEENFLTFTPFIKGLYKRKQISYPKFYKMDNLSKLGFLTAELLLQENNVLSLYKPEKIGLVIGNSSSSLDTDLVHQASISDKANYFPSPSVFVYTLPNILIGEICIKHKIHGENAFFISKEFDINQMHRYVSLLLEEGKIDVCICGWIELLNDTYDAILLLVEKKKDDNEGLKYQPFNPDIIYQLYKQTGN